MIDQLDKKAKVFKAIMEKGTALVNKPKSPEFLGREVKRAKMLWDETNNSALDRLERLRGEILHSMLAKYWVFMFACGIPSYF